MIKAIIAYDGSNYAGWQKQTNALGIQEVFERALQKIHGEFCEVVASGRTDAKVHARGQVIHFQERPDIHPTQYKRALNGLLPLDIRVQSCVLVDHDFHARFSATRKRYDYICTLNKDDPFSFRYKTVLMQPVDLEKMKKGALLLKGTHDFTSYSSCKIDPRKPRTKTIHSIEIQEKDGDIRFSFVGTGFLRYQVRMMVGTLLALGQSKIEVEDVQKILDRKDKHACRFNAPPQGLYLMEVYYG